MPHSLVVNFMPKTPIYPEYLTGRHIHALFLTLVSSVDQELGDRLHGEKANKGFGLSPIQQSAVSDWRLAVSSNRNKPKLKKANSQQLTAKSLSWHNQEISPSTPCWWRIALLDEVLFSKLTGLWLNLNPDRAFHLGSADLCDRWNTYSEIPINPEIIEYIFPSRFEIKTEVVKNYDTHSFIGCIGEIGYRVLGDVEPLVIKQINALADFAMFSGIGRKTTMGMGMVRRV